MGTSTTTPPSGTTADPVPSLYLSDTFYTWFNNTNDLINKVKLITGDTKKYLKEVKRARSYIDKRWMETNIDYYSELYSFPYGSKERKLLNLENGIS